ncbi:MULTISPECIES: hypothetical protein [unclassified Pseudomonas]|uniref:hypothetical protein n=1 Tax=unclassified Pseudomonas TaxID=196821 RepID=UPI0011B75B86|nr:MULTISPECIES: hypothetical protein [unclassified Pseudomonas]MDW3713284.1 hypothetical protein [Pseudomonas sp. 2023EL-01195]
MANANFTVSPAPATADAFPKALLCMPELEKISCSIRGKALLHPLTLMGKRIRNAQLVSACNMDGYPFAPESSIAISTVLAVNLGSIEHGIESSLLLQDDDGSDPYYVDLAGLTILEVLSS